MVCVVDSFRSIVEFVNLVQVLSKFLIAQLARFFNFFDFRLECFETFLTRYGCIAVLLELSDYLLHAHFIALVVTCLAEDVARIILHED